MAGALGVVNALFKRAVCKAYPGQPCMGKKIIKPSFGEKFGDYKYNSRPLAQVWGNPLITVFINSFL